MTNVAVRSALDRIARRWEAEGKRTFVVAASAPTITRVLPEVSVASTRTVWNGKWLEQRVFERPDGYRTQSFAMVVASVPVRPVDRR
jgi:hypothetical protein